MTDTRSRGKREQDDESCGDGPGEGCGMWHGGAVVNSSFTRILSRSPSKSRREPFRPITVSSYRNVIGEMVPDMYCMAGMRRSSSSCRLAAVALVLIVGVLIVRPAGLFGRRVVQRV